MNEEDLPPEVEYWLSPDTKHDCYFNVGFQSGPIERIGAFKAFLIGYSNPLRAMLQESELAEQGDISIVDVTPDTFRDFLKCLYMGLTDTVIRNLSFQKCCDLLYISDKYLVTKLKEKLIEQCLNALSPDVSCITAACSSKVFMQEKCLEVALAKIVQCQIESIINTKEFYEITDDVLLWILKLDPLDIDELLLWITVRRWASLKTNSEDGNVIRQCILKLLKYIRFCTMDAMDFLRSVVPTGILTGDEVNEICNFFGSNRIPNMELICNTDTPRLHSENFKLPDATIFTYHLRGVRNLLQCSAYRYRSNKFEFHNFRWSVFILGIFNVIYLYLECKGPIIDVPSWKFCTRATFTLVSHKGPNYSQSLPYCEYCNKTTRRRVNFITQDELVDPSNNYVRDDSLIVLVTLSKER